jgi:hypothetical protein
MARPGLLKHPKFARMVYLLGVPVPHALGYMECLWGVCYERGDPLLGDALDVELAAQWPGEKGKLFEALRECRFIDQVEQDRYEVHDLFDHAPDYVRKRKEREHTRKRAYVSRDRALSAPWRPDAAKVSQNGHLGGQCPPNGDVSRTEADLGSPPPPPPPPNASPNGEACSEPAEPASEPAVSDPVVMTFPTVGKGGKEWHLRESKLAEYRESYPGVDALTECRKARQWCLDNPTKRKTASGMPRMLSCWLAKEQNSGRGRAADSPDRPPGESPAQYAARIQAERQAEAEAKAKARARGPLSIRAIPAMANGEAGG